MNATKRYPWLWDTDDTNEQFEAKLSSNGVGYCPKLHLSIIGVLGTNTLGGVSLDDTRRAMSRLISYAPLAEIDRLLPAETFCILWPSISGRVRSRERCSLMENKYRELLRQSLKVK